MPHCGKKLGIAVRWPWRKPSKDRQKVIVPAPPRSSEQRPPRWQPVPVHVRKQY